MEEVSAPEPEGAREIINRWKPFNRGEFPTAHMEQLYPALLRMSVVVRAEGKGEEYVVSVPAYACDSLDFVVCNGVEIWGSESKIFINLNLLLS